MKKSITILSVLFIAYIFTFLIYAMINTKTWSVDGNKYVFYSESNEALLIFHKPLLYIQHYVFNKPYILVHHTDPSGNKDGHYYE
jgi:hypothetical protein